jgi:hypothetical protein
LRTHESVEESVEENCSLIDGKATNKIVVSRNTANTARLVLAKTTHGLWTFVSGAAGSGVVTCIVPPRYRIEND